MKSLRHPALLRVLRFLISGCTAAVVNLSTLYVATEYFNIWYIFSATIAFITSFFVSFLLQKFWTFRDNSTQMVHRQVFLYFAIAIMNLLLDIGALYLLVEYVHLHYVLAQFVTMGAIAIESFFVYRRFVFTQKEDTSRETPVFKKVFDFLPLKHAGLLILSAIIFSFLPYAHITFELGHAPLLPIAEYNDADYYLDRMQEIIDGYPMLGNPYFFEHREDPPPAFFLADWISALPLMLGIPLMQTIYLNFFGWSLVFLFFAYALLRVIGLNERLSLLGAILVYAEVYVFMLRPVSMQVVFPFYLLFLIAYMLWLRVPESRYRQLALGASAAVAAAMYTYAWQIIFVVLVLTAMAHFVFHRTLRPMIIPLLTFFLGLAPFIVLTILQIQNPFYEESLARIGLVHTHLPIFAAFVIVISPIVAGLLALVTMPKTKTQIIDWLRSPAIHFFGITGIAITGVMFSNIITGLDLELPQHIERFLVLWLGFASIFVAVEFYGVFPRLPRMFKIGGGVLCVILIAFNASYVMKNAVSVLTNPLERNVMEKTEAVVEPLRWLSEHAPKESVIWVDLDSDLNKYVAMLSPHYVLSHKGGGLHIVSDEEVLDRYLTAHYFSLTRHELLQEHDHYAGTGNAIHLYKTHNRRVRLCRLFQLEIFGKDCGQMTDHESYTGERYFDNLFARFKGDTQPRIAKKLAQYKVAYIVADKLQGSEFFKPETLKGTEKQYDDGRFLIYRYSPPEISPEE